MVGFLVVLVAAAASAGTVSVQLPQGTKCDFGQLRAALRVPPGSVSETPGPDSVQLTLSRQGEAWSLALEAPGQAKLERQAFAQGDDCVAVFEAAALIVDRYLSSIDWKPSPVEVSPLPPPEPPTPLQLLAEVGGGASYSSTGVNGAGAVGLGVVYGSLFAELEGAFLGFSRSSIPVTDNAIILTLQTWSADALVGARWRLGPGRLMFALMGGVELFNISAVPAQAHPNPLFNSVPPPNGGILR